MAKYLYLNERDILELYEKSVDRFVPGCANCRQLKAKIEKFLGLEACENVVNHLKKYPYAGENNYEQKNRANAPKVAVSVNQTKLEDYLQD